MTRCADRAAVVRDLDGGGSVVCFRFVAGVAGGGVGGDGGVGDGGDGVVGGDARCARQILASSQCATGRDVKVHLLLVKGANALPGCVEGVGMVCSRQLSVVVRKGGIG